MGGVQISEKDEAVLAYLTDITWEDLAEESPKPPKAEKKEDDEDKDDEDDEPHGFRLMFHFAPNPFFPHEALVRAAWPGCRWSVLVHVSVARA